MKKSAKWTGYIHEMEDVKDCFGWWNGSDGYPTHLKVGSTLEICKSKKECYDKDYSGPFKKVEITVREI